MNDISDLAARWGVAPEYFDAFGERRMWPHPLEIGNLLPEWYHPGMLVDAKRGRS